MELLGSQSFQFMNSVLKSILSQKVFNQTGCHNLDSHGICHLPTGHSIYIKQNIHWPQENDRETE